jgi:hypothetical protein
MSAPSSQKAFNQARQNAVVAPAKGKTKPAKPKMLPCSVRFTAEEKAYLERAAGNQSLAAHIRFKALDGNISERSPSHLRKQYKPKMDYELIAKLLGMLGQSELGPSMIALAAAADIGALDVDEDTHTRLHTACDDIALIRSSLIVALGIKPQGNGDT